ncbi:MAG: PRC-barrel domain-containing protein [Bacillota bacterium]
MRTRRGIIGLPVISLQTGKKLGEVRDLLIGRRGDRLSGLRVVCKGRFSPKSLRFRDIHSLGEDAVIVHDSTALLAPSRVRAAEAGARGPGAIIGKRVLTADGRDLGTIDDLVVDTVAGKVSGYEISDGFVRDVVDGKVILPVPPGMKVGQDAVIIPAEWAKRVFRPGAAEAERASGKSPETPGEGGQQAEHAGLPAMWE